MYFVTVHTLNIQGILTTTNFNVRNPRPLFAHGPLTGDSHWLVHNKFDLHLSFIIVIHVNLYILIWYPILCKIIIELIYITRLYQVYAPMRYCPGNRLIHCWLAMIDSVMNRYILSRQLTKLMDPELFKQNRHKSY